VTVNHRLNAFGYLDLSGIGDDRFSASGNAGMLDLVAALEWVRENIGAFGGDPDNVTIFGQSGGGAKVSTLMAMPAARGLFHRAIIQSGARLEADSTVDTARVSGDVLKELGISGDVSKLQEIPADNLLQAAAAVHQRYGPVMDGTILPTHPFEPEASPLGSDIPVIVGLTKDEATLYNVGHESWREMTEEELLAKSREEFPENADALLEAFRELHPGNAPRYLYTDLKTTEHYMRAVRLAERKAAQKSAPVFLYMFEWEAPVHDSMLRAPHTIEIPFIFDNVAKAPLLLGNDAATLQLGTAMSTIWSTFARTGRPEAQGLPEWPPYDSEDRATMVLNTTSRVVNDHHGSVRTILSGA
jgi:para-nitrobenzyl esterase